MPCARLTTRKARATPRRPKAASEVTLWMRCVKSSRRKRSSPQPRSSLLPSSEIGWAASLALHRELFRSGRRGSTCRRGEGREHALIGRDGIPFRSAARTGKVPAGKKASGERGGDHFSIGHL